MRLTIFFALFFIVLGAKAQSVSYSVECPKPDSCFLKEVSIGSANENSPRPQTVVSWSLFRKPEELQLMVENIRKKAAEQLQKGMELVNVANAMNTVAAQIEALKPKPKQ